MSITDTLKEAVKLAKEYNRMELYQELLRVQEELVDLKEQLLLLRAENQELKDKLDMQLRMVFYSGICWIKDDPMTDSKDDTPICPRCWQAEKTVVRLPLDGQYLHCTNCGKNHTLS